MSASLLRTLKPNSLSTLYKSPISSFLRTMATQAPKFEYLVILPDQPGKLAKRVEIRPKHFEGLQPNIENGFWKMGGAILDSVPKEGEGLAFKGSAMVALASSEEEVLEQLKADIYARNEVWDFSKIQIYPFKCAFRNPVDK